MYMHYTSTQAVLVRWDANDRVEGAARGEDRERLQAPEAEKSRASGANITARARGGSTSTTFISRGRRRRRRTGSVVKVPVFVVPQLATKG